MVQTRSGTRAQRGGCGLGWTQGSNGMIHGRIPFPFPQALKLARWLSTGALPSGALSAAWPRTLRVQPCGPPRHSTACPATVTGRDSLTAWAGASDFTWDRHSGAKEKEGRSPHTGDHKPTTVFHMMVWGQCQSRKEPHTEPIFLVLASGCGAYTTGVYCVQI